MMIDSSELVQANGPLEGQISCQAVAVKVRHPGVARTLHADFQIMAWLAGLAARLPALRDLRFEDSVRMFGVPLHQQLDLTLEAAHLERFRHNFRTSAAVTFPAPVWPFVAEEVLVETFEPGRIVRDFVYQSSPYNRAIAQTGLQAFLQMLLQDNWLHADLHPGNIIVQTHEGPALPPWLEAPVDTALRAAVGVPLRACLRSITFAIVDAGMVSRMQPRHFAALVDVYRGLAAFDGDVVGEAMARLRHDPDAPGAGPALRRAACDVGAFRAEVREIFRGVDAAVMHDNTPDVVGRVLDSMRRHRLTLDGAVSTTLITVLTLEGWAAKLDPDIRILDTIKGMLPQPWGARAAHAVDVNATCDLLDLA